MIAVKNHTAKSMGKTLGVFGLALSSTWSALSWGDDTEIYFGGSIATANTIAPNILFVLDTSGSMAGTVTGTGKSRLENMKDAMRNIINNSNNINVGLMRFNNPGGPVLYPVRNLDQAIGEANGDLSVRIADADDDAIQFADSSVSLADEQLLVVQRTTGGSGEESIQIVNRADDAEQEVFGDRDLNVNSSDLDIPFSGNSLQVIGLRFSDGNSIPKGALIQSAEIVFREDDDDGGSLNLLISGELGGDPGDFNSRDILSRTNRTGAVLWNNVEEFNGRGRLVTPNIAAVVQTIINDPSWNTGDPLTFFIERFSGNGRREADSSNGSASRAPVLRVTYQAGAPSVENLKVGLRFTDVQIPRGVDITSASIDFVVKQTSSDTASFNISAQNVDDAPAFTDTANDLSIVSRPRTIASATWMPGNWNSIGETVRSVDISNVIEEVSSRANWCGGNDIALFLEGVGERFVGAFDEDGAVAANLNITFDPDSAPADACVNSELVYQVANGSDDAEEKLGENANLSSNALQLIRQGGSNQEVGMRFAGVQLPQGAMVQEAYLEFTANDSDSGGTNLSIFGDDVGDSPTFGETTDKVRSRTKTSAVTNWNGVPAWTENLIYRTPDISAVVQEILNRGDWGSGNAMSFIITGNGTREAESHNGSPADAPRLVIRARRNYDPTEGLITARDELLDVVDDLTDTGATPVVGTFYEAARYYRGEQIDYGAFRGFSGNNDRDELRVSHSDSWVQGEGILVQPPGCSSDNLNDFDCANEVIIGNPRYISPITDECQSNHIVLLTDGQANRNTAAAKIRAMTGDSSCFSTGNSAEDCGLELAEFLFENDQISGVGFNGVEDQTITTHTVGFNFSTTWLQDLANRGGGGFYTANDANQLTTAFQQIIREVLKVDSTFVSPAVAINQFNRLNHRNEIYFAVFKPDESALWNGNVKRYTLSGSNNTIVDANSNQAVNPATGFFDVNAQSIWSSTADGSRVEVGGVAENLVTAASREVYTYTGSNVDLTTSTNELIVSNGAVSKTLLGNASMSDTRRTTLINFARGVDVTDRDQDGSITDTRQLLADPLHSKPLAFTYGGTEADPDIALLFGTNDGFFHAVNATDGSTLWSYMPSLMLDDIGTLVDNSSAEHPYGIDGSPTMWINNDPVSDAADETTDGEITFTNAGDFAYVYYGMRRGGRNYHAMDVTDITTPKFLWEIQGGVGDFVELGQTWSKPIKTRIRVKTSGSTFVIRDILIFSGGYDDDQDDVSTRTPDNVGRAIFMVDAETGALVWSGGKGASHTENFVDMDYSIPATPGIIDIDGDGLADQIFVGDTGGQLWRFIINNGETINNLVDGGVIADIAADGDEANTRRFYHTPDVALLRDANSALYLAVAIGSGYQAHPLSDKVDDRFYAFRLYDPFEPSTDFSVVTTESDLFDATNNDIGQGATQDIRDAAAQALEDADGYYIRMTNSGEKVLSSPLTVFGKAVFTTYTPATNLTGCTVQPGLSREYVVNLSNATPALNLDNFGDVDNLTVGDRSRQLASGSIVDEPIIVFTEEGGGSTFLGTEQGSLNIGNDRVVKTFWYQEEGQQ